MAIFLLASFSTCVREAREAREARAAWRWASPVKPGLIIDPRDLELNRSFLKKSAVQCAEMKAICLWVIHLTQCIVTNGHCWGPVWPIFSTIITLLSFTWNIWTYIKANADYYGTVYCAIASRSFIFVLIFCGPRTPPSLKS